jgi:hypothetical protein
MAAETVSRALQSTWERRRSGARARAFAHLTVAGFLVLIVSTLIPRIGGLGERLFLAGALLWMLVVALELRAPPDGDE